MHHVKENTRKIKDYAKENIFGEGGRSKGIIYCNPYSDTNVNLELPNFIWFKRLRDENS